MGRVRTKTIKKASKVIVEKYFAKLNTDFQTNKKVCEEVAIIPTKALRNKIAGYVTHLMRRIQKGPVRGISLKVQEEERARRMDYIPEISYVDEQISKGLEVDDETSAMLDALAVGKMENLRKVSVSFPTHARRFRKGVKAAPRK